MTIVWVTLSIIALMFMVVVFRGAPYVPSRRQDIEKAFDELYAVGPNDLVVDVGSGDGVVLRAAARRGAKAIGFELNPILVLISRLLSRNHPSVVVRLTDAWLTTVPTNTTLLYVFSTGRDIEKIAVWAEKQALAVGHSLYLISYGFELKRSVLRSHGAHHLYEITALQSPDDKV